MRRAHSITAPRAILHFLRGNSIFLRLTVRPPHYLDIPLRNLAHNSRKVLPRRVPRDVALIKTVSLYVHFTQARRIRIKCRGAGGTGVHIGIRTCRVRYLLNACHTVLETRERARLSLLQFRRVLSQFDPRIRPRGLGAKVSRGGLRCAG